MRRNSEVLLARRAKKVGIDKARYLELRTKALRTSAAAQGWQPAELAASIADIEQIADETWKKETP